MTTRSSTSPVYKQGLQSADDPLEFVMSTDDVDRHGDIVEQDWKLSEFKKNPIALFGHSSGFPIGTWEKVRVEGGKLMGRLKLAAKGTSNRIDEIRELLEQRILRAVSVGFMPGEAEPLDEEKPWGGYRLRKNSLLECSLVSVPANSAALLTSIKALGISEDTRRLLLGDDVVAKECGSACAQLHPDKSRVSGAKNPPSNPKSRTTTVTNRVSEKIVAKEAEITALRNRIQEINESDVEDDGSMSEETSASIQELSDQIEKAEENLATLKRIEKQTMIKSKPAGDPEHQSNSAASRIEIHQHRQKGHRSIAVLATMLKAHCENRNPVDIVKDAFRDEPEILMLTRAAVDPAITTDAAWAQPLVRETWGEFLDLIRDISVYPRVPGVRFDFDRYGQVTFPSNTGRGKLAAGWVGENKPIPVKEGAFGGKDMTPKKLGVISVFSKEIGRRSIPAIEGVIRQQMLDDTAEGLDTYFMDAVARSVTRPAGLQDATETVAANIVASTGATSANIDADVRGVLSRVIGARAGMGGAWIMNSLRRLGLEMVQNAANGTYPYRSAVQAGVFAGYPIIVSDNVPSGVVAFVGGQAIAHGNDYAPMIDVSDQPTLHMEDTTPLEIVDGTGTAAQPVISVWQQDGVALKMTMGLDWRIVRPGGVQVLTGVAW
jgi:HK97 family phage major capsid protein/HK97 family phage prohead protease